MDSQPWVKIYDEQAWDDSIVGNREGLLALKQAIDDALKSECVEVVGRFQSDFGMVVLSDQDWEGSEPEEESRVAGAFIMVAFFVWVIALPLFDLYKLLSP